MTGPLPAAAAQHMFPAGAHMPQLRKVTISSFWPKIWSPGDDDEVWSVNRCLTNQDLESIISCCPALQSLHIPAALNADADVSALLQLPASCTALGVGGEAFADADVSVLLQLTQLQDLTWAISPGLTRKGGLQLLVALKSLTRLQLYGSAEQAEDCFPQDLTLCATPDDVSGSFAPQHTHPFTTATLSTVHEPAVHGCLLGLCLQAQRPIGLCELLALRVLSCTW
jgi:hypothetical protein